jgi:hypothetical protein
MKEGSDIVERGESPHFPLLYTHFKCDTCSYINPKLKNAPRQCSILVAELFSMDLKNWLLEKRRSDLEMRVAIWQIMCGISTFHMKMGYAHNDLHWGNVLVLKHVKNLRKG